MAMLRIDSRVSEERIKSIPPPEFTDTWHPYSHGKILSLIENVAKKENLPIQEKAYSLSADGGRMVGVWTLKEKNTKHIGKDTIFQALFFRNSIDKSYAFGLNAGTQVHICTNLNVFGDFLEFRRHTGGVDDGVMEEVITRGLSSISGRLKPLLEWHDSMRLVPLGDTEVKSLVYDAIQDQVISKQRLPQFHQLLFGESHKYDPSSLFGFHEACTDLISGLSMVGDFQEKQNKLNELIVSRYADKLAPLPVPSLN